MFKIISDSCSNLPNDFIIRNDIEIISFMYISGGKPFSAYSKGQDFDGKQFYNSMRYGTQITTTMISMGEYYDVFEKYLSQGIDVLYIGMSSAISGAYGAAFNVAGELSDKYPERKIRTIDTRAASLGEGMAVIEAVRLRQEKMDFDDVADKTENFCDSICQYFTVDSLMYLKRGGRLSGTAAIVGSVLNIKPILRGDDTGHIASFAKVRGRKKSISYLAELYSKLAYNKNENVYIAHGDCEEEAFELEIRLAESGHKGKCITVCYEPVTGSHVGPGTIALFFKGIQR